MSSWNESVDAAKRLGRMFNDFALVSSKFEEAARLENHTAELSKAVAKGKAEVVKAQDKVKAADEKAEQLIVEAQGIAASITTDAEAAAADTLSRARIAADELVCGVEAKHKEISSACETASMRLDLITGQIADGEIELRKIEDRLKLARDRVAAILKG